jgi:hypothetical protein
MNIVKCILRVHFLILMPFLYCQCYNINDSRYYYEICVVIVALLEKFMLEDGLNLTD